jgi:hypothetical protein
LQDCAKPANHLARGWRPASAADNFAAGSTARNRRNLFEQAQLPKPNGSCVAERSWTKPTPKWCVLNGMRTFVRDSCALADLTPVLLRQFSRDLHVRLAIPVVQGDTLYAFWQLGKLIDVVSVLFEQLQQCLGGYWIQFLAITVHAELKDDLFAQGIQLLTGEILRLRLAPKYN